MIATVETAALQKLYDEGHETYRSMARKAERRQKLGDWKEAATLWFKASCLAMTREDEFDCRMHSNYCRGKSH